MRSDFAGLVAGIAAERRPPTAKDNSDEALVAKIASGNRLAMQVLFARHHARIYRFVLRLLGSEALAEDVTSEVFLRPPAYKPVWVSVGIRVVAGFSQAEVREAVKQRLLQFLSPLPSDPDQVLEARPGRHASTLS